MSAVLAAARAAGCLVVILAMTAAIFWTWAGPQGLWTVVWLVAMGLALTGLGVLAAVLWPRKGGG